MNKIGRGWVVSLVKWHGMTRSCSYFQK